MKTLTIAFLLLLLTAFPAAAQFNAHVQLGLGATTYDNFFGVGQVKSSDWLTVVSGTFVPADDLLVAVTHSGGRARTLTHAGTDHDLGGGDTASRGFTQGALLVDVFRDSEVTVYGGLGYQLTRAEVSHSAIQNGGAKLQQSLNGYGFMGQVLVDIDIMEDVLVQASVTGTPWYTYKYTRGNSSEDGLRGSAYTYQVGISYEVTEGIGIRAGYMGGNVRIPPFEFRNDEDIPVTRGRYSAITGGVSLTF